MSVALASRDPVPMRRLRPLLPRGGALAAVALALGAASAPAQAYSWTQLVAEADSVGAEAPRLRPGPWDDCGSTVPVPDSVRVGAGTQTYLLASRSLRTRGMLRFTDPPRKGDGSFSVRQVWCDEEDGRPRAFVVERDHRWLYLMFHLRDDPSYDALRFFSGSARPLPFRWDPARRRFGAVEAGASGGR